MVTIPQKICAGVCALMGFAAPSLGQKPSQTELDLLATQISTASEVQHLFEQCPADIWKTRQNWRHWFFIEENEWDLDSCRDDVRACGNSCVNKLSGSACFSAALVLEEHGLPEFDLQHRYAFSLACASGTPAGCTNRAANIRNAASSTDKLSQNKSKETWNCLRRTFSVACDAGNPWGCAMEGQALRLGEGGAVDFKQARSRLEKACALGRKPEKEEAKFAPCRFAKTQLEILDETD